MINKHCSSLSLRILTGKINPQIKLKCLRKVRICILGELVQQINYLWEVLILKLSFQKNEVVSGKNSFFVIGSFVLPIQFVLTLSFDWVVLNRNVALSFAELKTVLQFSKKSFRFPEILFLIQGIENMVIS